MWIFTNFGLIMPAAVIDSEVPEAFNGNGLFDLQVRGRVEIHLRHFIDNYMEPGTFSDIQYTPENDYNMRFYTTHEEFAKAVSKLVMEIDYRKFKPSTERFSWTHTYHNVLNSIWSTLLALAPAGGAYGPRSDENPNGYFSARQYSNFFQGSGADADWWNAEPDLTGMEPEEDLTTDGYTPSKIERRAEAIHSLKGIPADQWEEMCTQEEWELIKADAEKIMKARMREDLKRNKNFAKKN